MPEKVAAQRRQVGRTQGIGRVRAVARHLGRDALPELALAPGIEQQAEVGVGVDVDDARRDDQS